MKVFQDHSDGDLAILAPRGLLLRKTLVLLNSSDLLRATERFHGDLRFARGFPQKKQFDSTKLQKLPTYHQYESQSTNCSASRERMITLSSETCPRSIEACFNERSV